MSPRVFAFVFSRHFLTGAAFVLFAVGLGLTSLIIGARASDLAREGLNTQATVTARDTRVVGGSAGRSSSVTHLLTVDFVDTALTPVTAQIAVTEAFFDQTQVGDTVPLRHLPDDPGIAEIIEGSVAEDAAGFGGIALLCLLAGLFFWARAGWAARGVSA